MKNRILSLGLAAIIILAFAGCGAQSKNDDMEAVTMSTSEIAEGIKAQIEMKDGMLLIESDKNAENAFPGLLELTDEYTIYINATGGYAEEIAVFKLKEGKEMSELKSLVDERIQYQKIAFEDYQPREMPKLENPVIETYGDTMVFVVSDDSAAAKQAIKATIK